MVCRIRVLPHERNIEAPAGENLLDVLRQAGLAPAAPCSGAGRCGKCTVFIGGEAVCACRTVIRTDMTVTLPASGTSAILTDGLTPAGQAGAVREGYLLALDLGTTTVAGYLLEGRTGRTLAVGSLPNPQADFGADVVSRIRHALKGQLDILTDRIRGAAERLAGALCREAGIHPGQISVVCPVGNPAMQQLFLGISPENLARIPFAPVLTEARTDAAKAYLPAWENAALLVVPDISGFVGADTVACVLAAEMDKKEELTLLVDIGTNGEMVLGNRHRMTACSAAAGPALEGAGIRWGMSARRGAIDHVTRTPDGMRCSVIGGGTAEGICGSGLIDAVAAALDAGVLNSRGKILTVEGTIPLTDGIFLTQEDIRQVQLAKGAIAAGIDLMAAHLGADLADVERVYLAGAFGTFLDPASACRMGLLPAALAGRITAIGNAAGSGARILARDADALDHAAAIVARTEFIELAAQPGFSRCFAKNMRF